ncbi:hypothetical protein QSJ18_05750 [Gordonia sp. ABSL1-1]|uniref:hypothetical protein n=1 Tax=Gordonia sp. ABSL1-1 TaxID=3053923 RepID=UPI002573977F|nr:hypothetical protein [Gordonia sp. ABSL1-1]MDL9936240.1 hypothetical protein [Gordonia sp. ABSL1-1]
MPERMHHDPEESVVLNRRLSEVGIELATMREAVTDIIVDLDSAIGVGAAADAFRRGFVGLSSSAQESLEGIDVELIDATRAIYRADVVLTDTDIELGRNLDGFGRP